VKSINKGFTLGKKNTDFQIKQFESNAQPNYILLDSRKGNEKVLKPQKQESHPEKGGFQYI